MNHTQTRMRRSMAGDKKREEGAYVQSGTTYSQSSRRIVRRRKCMRGDGRVGRWAGFMTAAIWCAGTPAHATTCRWQRQRERRRGEGGFMEMLMQRQTVQYVTLPPRQSLEHKIAPAGDNNCAATLITQFVTFPFESMSRYPQVLCRMWQVLLLFKKKKERKRRAKHNWIHLLCLCAKTFNVTPTNRKKSYFLFLYIMYIIVVLLILFYY